METAARARRMHPTKLALWWSSSSPSRWCLLQSCCESQIQKCWTSEVVLLPLAKLKCNSKKAKTLNKRVETLCYYVIIELLRQYKKFIYIPATDELLFVPNETWGVDDLGASPSEPKNTEIRWMNSTLNFKEGMFFNKITVFFYWGKYLRTRSTYFYTLYTSLIHYAVLYIELLGVKWSLLLHTWTGIIVNMHTAKKWQLKCQSGVYWKSADASLIEQQAKTIWLLDIELPEVTATPLGRWRRSALHKRSTGSQSQQ